MIEFLPFVVSESEAVYRAYENGDITGECSFTFEGSCMRITGLSGDDLTGEGLVRSAMNYAANRGAYTCSAAEDMLCPALSRLGFSGSCLTVEIPEALTSSCCKHEIKSE